MILYPMNLNDIKEKCKRQYWPERDEDLPEEYYMIQWLIAELEQRKKAHLDLCIEHEELTRDRDKYKAFYHESVKAHREALERLDKIANLQGDEINRAWGIADGDE